MKWLRERLSAVYASSIPTWVIVELVSVVVAVLLLSLLTCHAQPLS